MKVERITGHGGFFKTPGVGQRYLSAAVGAPVTVMANAGEGGPWGMALLALYMIVKEENETLESFLEKKIFAGAEGSTLAASEEEMQGFEKFMESYKAGLGIEKAAIEALR